MIGEGVGIFADLQPCVSTRLNLADEMKPAAIVMETGIGAVRLINFGRFLVIDTEHLEELSYRWRVGMLKCCREIATQRARAVRRTALCQLRVACASGVCIVFDLPSSNVSFQSAREFLSVSKSIQQPQGLRSLILT